MVVRVGVKIQFELVNFQVYRDGIIHRDGDISLRRDDMNGVFCRRNSELLHFFPNVLANLIFAFVIDHSKARFGLNGILELKFREERGNDVDGGKDEEAHHKKREHKIQLRAALLRSASWPGREDSVTSQAKPRGGFQAIDSS